MFYFEPEHKGVSSSFRVPNEQPEFFSDGACLLDDL